MKNMKILVHVKPFSKQQKIEKNPQSGFSFSDQDSYTVWVNQIPEDGKANAAVIQIMAEYFKVSKSDIILISGEKSRYKIFDIRGGDLII